jgi:AcrB/AcrD/AcrF family
MADRHDDRDSLLNTRNTARFFTETPHVAWVLLVGTILWGVYGYRQMPQRKDPDIPVRQALALCPWPGASAEKIEQLVTRRIEEKVGERQGRQDRVEHPDRHHRRLHDASGRPARYGQGVRRHQAEAGRHR